MKLPRHAALAVALGSALICQSAWPAAAFDPEAAVSKAVVLLRKYYVMRDKVDPVIAAIERRRDQGAYSKLHDRASFAEAMTEDLRAVSNDRHLYVEVLADPLGPSSASSDEQWAKQENRREIESNFGFSAAKILAGNVGYIRITGFMEPQRSLETATSAMRFVSNTSALVLDLRGNTGGYGGIAEYLASYFFDSEPTLLTTTKFQSESSAQTWSLPAVDGERRVGTPIFVLVDNKTGSAAEWLAYTLQSFGKAKVVGERTSGGANRNTFFDLGTGLRMSISTGMPLSEANGRNWEGVGVVPDAVCDPDEALETALQLARR